MKISQKYNGIEVEKGKSILIMKDQDDKMFYCKVNEDIANSFGESFELSDYAKKKRDETYACPQESVIEINQ